jgi:hypothetical protein
MKVIGAGFGRTGTTSLKAALEKLGFGPCYHMTEVFAHPAHEAVCSAAGRGEPADLEAVLGGYVSTLDWPACTLYEELMERHPEAKVLLSVRDPERWYWSTRGAIYELTMLLDSSPTVRLIFGLIALLTLRRFRRGQERLAARRDLAGHLRAPSTGVSRTRPTPSRSSSGTTRR